MNLLSPPGKKVARKSLTIQRAREFTEFLVVAGGNVFAKLAEVRKRDEPPAEIVVFDVAVERPQKCVHDIRKSERIAVVFSPNDESQPEVLALRGDFPQAPHINSRETEFPRSLCLYDQPYEDMRLTWTPSNFLHRIRFWLERTATGNLHGEDQPLAPLIFGSGATLIVPADFAITGSAQNTLLDVFMLAKKPFILYAKHPTKNAAQEPDHVAASFSCAPQTHGVIRHVPTNLRELDSLCSDAGLPLVDELTKAIRAWHKDKPVPEVLKAGLIILLLLHKKRKENGAIERVETRAFLTFDSVQDVGVALGAMESSGGFSGAIIGNQRPKDSELEKVGILQADIVNAISPDTAAMLNGIEPSAQKITAIGMGTIGSQVASNLFRAGYGRWTLIDDDTLLPHNCARHFLGNWALGINKATAMASLANKLFDSEEMAQALTVNVLKPGKAREQVAKALSDAEVVMDFSASVAVSRHLAHRDIQARTISAYMTPKGDGLIVAAEDAKRTVRLDWLEMLHYRQVLNQPELRKSLLPNDDRVRYGNACRDVSSQLSQDDAALWSAIASKSVKQMNNDDSSALRIVTQNEDGSVSRHSAEVFEPL